MNHSKLFDLAVSDSGFVFDPYTGATFTVNATGLTILQGLKEGLEREALLAKLGDAFDVDGADLERDLDEFVGLLRQNHLVPRDFSL